MATPEPHPWLQPLYRRVLLFIVTLAWLGFELIQQDPLWLTIAVGVVLYAGWDFFLRGVYGRSTDKP